MHDRQSVIGTLLDEDPGAYAIEGVDLPGMGDLLSPYSHRK